MREMLEAGLIPTILWIVGMALILFSVQYGLEKAVKFLRKVVSNDLYSTGRHRAR